MNATPPPILPADQPHEPPEKITALMRRFINQLAGDSCTVAELLDYLGPRAFGVVMFVFGVPTAILGGIPGISTVLSLPFFLLGFQMLLGLTHPWVPPFLAHITFKKDLLNLIVDKAEPTLLSVEKLLKPRWFIFDQPGIKNLLGGFILIVTTALALPGFLGNFLPAMGMALIGLGYLERDGGCVGAGILMGLAGVIWIVVLYVSVFVLGVTAFDSFLK